MLYIFGYAVSYISLCYTSVHSVPCNALHFRHQGLYSVHEVMYYISKVLDNRAKTVSCSVTFIGIQYIYISVDMLDIHYFACSLKTKQPVNYTYIYTYIHIYIYIVPCVLDTI